VTEGDRKTLYVLGCGAFIVGAGFALYWFLVAAFDDCSVDCYRGRAIALLFGAVSLAMGLVLGCLMTLPHMLQRRKRRRPE
jgi:hypothetical protein